MFANIFSNRLFIGVLVFVLLLAMGCGLYYGRKVATQEPVKIYKPVEVEQPTSEEPMGDTLPTEPHDGEKLPLVDASEKHNRVVAPQPSGYPPLPPSSVPDDIPEHLKLPEEWKTGPYQGFTENSSSDNLPPADVQHLRNILNEIIWDYNPQRPIGDIWNQYIEYEKMYRAHAEHDLGYTPLGGVAYNRTDWIYEQTWAFPEIMAVLMSPTSRDEINILRFAKDVAMGELSPDWNQHTLHDGREFYLRYDRRYEFKWVTAEGVEQTIGFSRTSNKNAPLVVIHPDTTSNEELERLGWWNFHINPYTLQPVQFERYHITNKWELE